MNLDWVPRYVKTCALVCWGLVLLALLLTMLVDPEAINMLLAVSVWALMFSVLWWLSWRDERRP